VTLPLHYSSLFLDIGHPAPGFHWKPFYGEDAGQRIKPPPARKCPCLLATGPPCPPHYSSLKITDSLLDVNKDVRACYQGFVVIILLSARLTAIPHIIIGPVMVEYDI
jgi:hypothetical protein